MEDEVAVVEQDPFGLTVAFHVQRPPALGPEVGLDGVGDCLDLSRVVSVADDELFCERVDLADVEHSRLHGLAVYRGLYGDSPVFHTGSAAGSAALSHSIRIACWALQPEPRRSRPH